MRGISSVSITVTIVACAFWALDFGGFWDSRQRPSMHDAAVTVSVAAVMFWLARWRLKRDQDKELLIRTLADVARGTRELPRTLPLPIPVPFRRVP